MHDNPDETCKLVQCMSNSIECMKERNNALITSQRSLHSLVEHQGQPLSQAVSNLES